VQEGLLTAALMLVILALVSTSVEVILRMLIVKRLYRWTYQEVEYFVSDSLVSRQFCRTYLKPVPDDTTLIRWPNEVGPKSLQPSMPER
jgi:IS5 family transposase